MLLIVAQIRSFVSGSTVQIMPRWNRKYWHGQLQLLYITQLLVVVTFINPL